VVTWVLAQVEADPVQVQGVAGQGCLTHMQVVPDWTHLGAIEEVAEGHVVTKVDERRLPSQLQTEPVVAQGLVGGVQTFVVGLYSQLRVVEGNFVPSGV
jgi:hypothetical protein